MSTRAVARLAGLLATVVLLGTCSPSEPPPPHELGLDGYHPASAAGLRAEGWRTDFDRRSVPLGRILAGGPPREAFVPIEPVATARADAITLEPDELVLVARAGDELRAWPIAHLAARELALDELAGLPVAVTYCSLCASARVWDRRAGGEVLELAVSGLLLRGNSLLFDRRTESLWSQLTGEAVAGAHTGLWLTALPAFTVPFAELLRAHPGALVMLAPGGPEPPIDRIDAGEAVPPWLHTACPDPLAAMLALPEGVVPLEDAPAVRNLEDLVVLDGAAFRREVDGRPLSFEAAPEGTRDVETGSTWNALGEAVAGPLAGRSLEPAPQTRVFRFAAPEGGLKLSGP